MFNLRNMPIIRIQRVCRNKDAFPASIIPDKHHSGKQMMKRKKYSELKKENNASQRKTEESPEKRPERSFCGIEWNQDIRRG
jgi:hypothetical protein